MLYGLQTVTGQLLNTTEKWKLLTLKYKVLFTSIIYSREADNGSFIQIFTRSSLEHNALHFTAHAVAVDSPLCLFKTLLNSHSNAYCEGKMSVKDTSPGIFFQPIFPCMQNISTRNLSLWSVQHFPYRTRGPDLAPNMPEHKRITELPAWISQLQ